MNVFVCVVMSKRVSNTKRGQDAKDVVMCVIVPSLASPHVVEWLFKDSISTA